MQMNTNGLIKRMWRFFACLLLALGPVASQTNSSPGQVVFLNLRLRGFEPPIATAKAGKILLVVNNQTGRPVLHLHVAAEKGPGLGLAAVADFSWRPTATNRSTLLNLTAGSYKISENSNSGLWTCTLTVQ